MAKQDKTYTMKGNLDFTRGIIKEFNAKTEEEKIYDLFDKLHEFNGQEVTVTIKATTELESDDVVVSKFVADDEYEEE